MKRTTLLACVSAFTLALTSSGQDFGGFPSGGGGGGSRQGGGGGQSTFGGGRGGGQQQQAAWKQFKLPNKKIKLDFRNASIDMILAFFTQQSGVTIVKDPALKDPISLTTATAVSVSDAFEVLNAALTVRNYSLSKEGNVLLIRNNNRGGGQQPTFDPAMMAQMMQGRTSSQIDLQVYKIKYAAASQVARVVNEVFAQSGGGGSNPFSMFGGGGMMQFGRGGRTGGRGGGFNPFSMGMGGEQQINVRASSDDYSNTVIVNAPRTLATQIADLIDEIDKQTDEPQKTKVYKLEFAVADDVQPVIQSVLQASVPRGRGNTGQQNQGGGGGGFFGAIFGGGRNNTQGGTVTSDDRSNAVVVTTTETNQATIASLVKELDAPVEVKQSTIVIPLVNARADQMATLFRQAFGQRQGTNGGNTGTGRTNTGTNNATQRRNTNTRTGGGGGGTIGFNPDGTVASIDLDVNDDGTLKTSVDVMDGAEAQIFGGFQQGGGQNRQNQQGGGTTTARGADGRLIQVQNLQNQITVIPDQNTNSIIVVGSPDSADLIRQLVSQLDRIPEQVMIETIIVEASLDATQKLGIEWNLTKKGLIGGGSENNVVTSGFGNQGSTGQPQGMRWTISGKDYGVFMNALQSDTKFNVLSTPRIFTSNNVQAEINISQRIPYVISQRTDANGNITYNYDFQDVGIVLTVTPRITAGGVVTMDVTQTANDLQGFTTFNAPIVNQRQAETTVSAKDGETIILGGIIRNSVTTTTNKIPLLGDLPVLGNLFKSTNKTNNKTELMVFLTPRIVRDPAETKNLTQGQFKELSPQSQGEMKKAGRFLGDEKKADDKHVPRFLGDKKPEEKKPEQPPVKK